VDGEKVKVRFETPATDPETGEVIRVDTTTLVFPATALAVVNGSAEAMQGALAAANTKVEELTQELAALTAAKQASEVELNAEVAQLTKKAEQQVGVRRRHHAGAGTRTCVVDHPAAWPMDTVRPVRRLGDGCRY
jgi:hypothetical protein